MLSSVVVTLVIVVVVGVIAAFIAYYVARFMKGSIKLSLPQTGFEPGQTITGSFDLETKKPITGKRLIVSLIGTQTTEIREDDRTRTRTREIYRNEVLIEEARDYPAGHTEQHQFEIATPNTGAPEFMNSAIGQTVTAALRLLSDRRTRLKWKVEARLDTKGVDLAASKTVSINMSQML
jgi:hypothetical protein